MFKNLPDKSLRSFHCERLCIFFNSIIAYIFFYSKSMCSIRINYVRINHSRNLLRSCFVYTCLHISENSKSVYEQPAYFNKTYNTLLSNQHNRDFKMSNGFGTITWWGFSPAIDLQNPGNLYRYDLTTCESNIENNH